ASQPGIIAGLIKGKKLQQAHAILEKQPGIDAKTLNIHLSYGNTLPGDVRQITINTVNPNLPSVRLPAT
ncbi:MAG: hypothetical protein JO215_01010, partial [Ktedonobacteraceae bacterium]|nr:hypothetical protein [Ktedonobacteraceae bacterium]